MNGTIKDFASLQGEKTRGITTKSLGWIIPSIVAAVVAMGIVIAVHFYTTHLEFTDNELVVAPGWTLEEGRAITVGYWVLTAISAVFPLVCTLLWAFKIRKMRGAGRVSIGLLNLGFLGGFLTFYGSAVMNGFRYHMLVPSFLLPFEGWRLAFLWVLPCMYVPRICAIATTALMIRILVCYYGCPTLFPRPRWIPSYQIQEFRSTVDRLPWAIAGLYTVLYLPPCVVHCYSAYQSISYLPEWVNGVTLAIAISHIGLGFTLVAMMFAKSKEMRALDFKESWILIVYKVFGLAGVLQAMFNTDVRIRITRSAFYAEFVLKVLSLVVLMVFWCANMYAVFRMSRPKVAPGSSQTGPAAGAFVPDYIRQKQGLDKGKEKVDIVTLDPGAFSVDIKDASPPVHNPNDLPSGSDSDSHSGQIRPTPLIA